MNQGITSTPNPPSAPSLNGELDHAGRGRVIQELVRHSQKLNGWLQRYFNEISQILNTATSTFGNELAAASTIIITNALHHVTGSAVITTLQVPPNFTGGPIYLVQDGSWTTATGGNIAVASAPTFGQMLPLVYDPFTGLFYPVLTGSSGGGGPTVAWFNTVTTSTTPFPVPQGQNLFIVASATPGSDFIANLPLATGSGFVYTLKKDDPFTHSVIWHPNGTNTIDGVSGDVAITIPKDTVTLVDHSNTAWQIWN